MTVTEQRLRARAETSAANPDGVVSVHDGVIVCACAHCDYVKTHPLPSPATRLAEPQVHDAQVEAIRQARWQLVDHQRERHEIARPSSRLLDADAHRVSLVRNNWGRVL